jgi:hypothetical protein
MKVETDLKKIKQTAMKNEDENWKFRSFLKGYDIEVEELDSIVHRLFEGVCREIDCKACGNCCKEISPVLEQEDIERISRGLGISPENFRERFLVKNDINYSEGFIFNKNLVLSSKGICAPITNYAPKLVGPSPIFIKRSSFLD